MAERDDEFLSRWSRRKAEARRAGRAPDEPERGAEGAPQRRDKAPSEKRVEGAGADQPDDAAKPSFDDIDFDKLDFHSDYTRFMKAGVPAAVQRRALRQLWRSDPVLAVLDGLNDYDLDYTDTATVVPDLKTAWKIGRGFLGGDASEEASAGQAEGAQAGGGDEAASPAQVADIPADVAGEGGADAGPEDADPGERA